MKKSRAPTAIDKHVASRLLVARVEAGRSQTEAGAIIDVVYQQVQKFEKANNRISAGALAQLARYYGKPIDWFFPPIQQAAE